MNMNTNHVVEESSLLQVEHEVPPSPALHVSAALVHRADDALCLHRQERVVYELQSSVNCKVQVDLYRRRNRKKGRFPHK